MSSHLNLLYTVVAAFGIVILLCIMGIQPLMINFILKSYNSWGEWVYPPHIHLTIILVCLPTLVEAGLSKTVVAPLPSFGNYQAKGFLSDYAKIRHVGGDSRAFVYSDNTVNRARYRKLMLDPIKIQTKRHTWPRPDSPVFGELAAYFRNAIMGAVADSYQIVDTPGPDVLRLRVAVADLEPNDPGISLITLVVPFLWIGEASAGAAQGDIGSTPFAGQAVVEMEIVDSLTNIQIAAYIERRVGKKYNWEAGFATGLSSYMKAFFTWAYTKDAFNLWADKLKSELKPNLVLMSAKNH